VNCDGGGGIDAVGSDITQHHQQQEPEIGPVALAFRLERDHGAIGIVAGIVTEFVGKVMVWAEPASTVGGTAGAALTVIVTVAVAVCPLLSLALRVKI